jgi:hypothetical protein
MNKTISTHARPVSYTKAVRQPVKEETPARVNPKSVTQRVMTLAWFLWGELTNNKRVFPGG